MPHTPPSFVNAGAESRPERRAFRRALLDRPALIETDTESVQGRVLNVSGGGASIVAPLELPPGASLSLYFELPIGYAVEARAEVLRSEDGEIAVKFVDLSRESQVALRSFCRISGLHRLRG